MKKACVLFLCLLCLTPIFSDELDEDENPTPPKGLSKYSLDFLLHVASLQEDGFSKPFASGGLLLLLSVPITRPGKNLSLHGQLGAGINYLSLSITQPDTSFTRLTFPFPVLLRLLKAMNHSITGEVFAGFIYRPFFYDSRPNTSGGFQSITEGILKPEVGFGLRIFLSPSLRLNIRASYFYLASGIEWIL